VSVRRGIASAPALSGLRRQEKRITCMNRKYDDWGLRNHVGP
jgi:hypothetical protein